MRRCDGLLLTSVNTHMRDIQLCVLDGICKTNAFIFLTRLFKCVCVLLRWLISVVSCKQLTIGKKSQMRYLIYIFLKQEMRFNGDQN